MAFAATTEAPPEMRERVMAAAARTRQLPPEIRTHARPRAHPRLGAVGTVAVRGHRDGRDRGRGVLRLRASPTPRTSSTRPGPQNQALAAAQARVEAELSQAKEHDQALAQILGAPHVTLLSQRTTKGGVAVVVLDAATRKLVVATSGLPALPAGKVYQLWLIGPVKIVSAGLLPTAQAGVTTPVVATGIVKGDKLGLTVEPARGSKQPTTTPILALPAAGLSHNAAPLARSRSRNTQDPPWPAMSSQGGSRPATGGVQAGQLQLVTRPPVMTTRPAGRCSSAQIVYGPAGRSG